MLLRTKLRKCIRKWSQWKNNILNFSIQNKVNKELEVNHLRWHHKGTNSTQTVRFLDHLSWVVEKFTHLLRLLLSQESDRLISLIFFFWINQTSYLISLTSVLPKMKLKKLQLIQLIDHHFLILQHLILYFLRTLLITQTILVAWWITNQINWLRFLLMFHHRLYRQIQVNPHLNQILVVCY